MDIVIPRIPAKQAPSPEIRRDIAGTDGEFGPSPQSLRQIPHSEDGMTIKWVATVVQQVHGGADGRKDRRERRRGASCPDQECDCRGRRWVVLPCDTLAYLPCAFRISNLEPVVWSSLLLDLAEQASEV